MSPIHWREAQGASFSGRCSWLDAQADHAQPSRRCGLACADLARGLSAQRRLAPAGSKLCKSAAYEHLALVWELLSLKAATAVITAATFGCRRGELGRKAACGLYTGGVRYREWTRP
jgi:hypothetical protein